MQKFLCTFLSLWLFVSAFSQAGSPDPTYGSSGIKAIGNPPDLSSSIFMSSFPADDGGSVDIFLSTTYDFTTIIMKRQKDGTVDVTYGNCGYISFRSLEYTGSVRQKDGRITITGIFRGGTGPFAAWDDAMIIRLNSNGSIDKSLRIGDPGSFYERPDAITLQDDKIVVWGTTASILYGYGYFIKVIYPDGSTKDIPAPNFFRIRENTDKITYYWEPFSPIHGLSVALEGEKALVQGPLNWNVQVQDFEGGYQFRYYSIEYGIARYNVDNSPDLTFGENGRMQYGSYPIASSFPPDAYTPKTTLNKNVVLSSVANPLTGNTDFKVTVYTLDGTLDEHFGTDGSTTIDFGGNDVPKAFVWQDGKLLVGGNSTHPETGITSFALARFNSDGTLDQSFDGDGKQLTFREGYHFNLQRLAIQTTGTQQRLLAVGDEVIAGYLLEDNVLLACTQSKVVATDAGKCRAVVNGIDPVLTASGSNAVVNYTMTGATIASGTGTASGMTFNKGVTTVTYSLASNSSQTCSFTVTVADQEAPVVSNLAASVTSIWPANHKLVDVWIGYDVADNCGAISALSITSNEPDKSSDPEDKQGDFIMVDNHHIQVRAERMGSGNGRTYTVAVTASDAAGNSTTKTIAILVPKNMGKNLSTTLVSKTAAQELQNANGLAVQALPNPSTGQFTLQLQSNSTQPFSIRVVDAQGRLMEMRSNPCAGALHFGSDYRPGVYFLEVQQGSERKQLRLLKLAH